MHPLIKQLVNKYQDLEDNSQQILQAFNLWKNSFAQGHKTLVCGNGGSASDSEHIVGELMKGFMLPRTLSRQEQDLLQKEHGEAGIYLAQNLQGALPAISLVSQTSLITAYANDVAADLVFAQQVYGYGEKGDVLVCLSTSGNSTNVLHALRLAKTKGLITIGLTGQTGGMMKQLCDVTIQVPYHSTPDIQERHLAVYHTLCAMLEQEFFS